MTTRSPTRPGRVQRGGRRVSSRESGIVCRPMTSFSASLASTRVIRPLASAGGPATLVPAQTPPADGSQRNRTHCRGMRRATLRQLQRKRLRAQLRRIVQPHRACGAASAPRRRDSPATVARLHRLGSFATSIQTVQKAAARQGIDLASSSAVMLVRPVDVQAQQSAALAGRRASNG